MKLSALLIVVAALSAYPAIAQTPSHEFVFNIHATGCGIDNSSRSFTAFKLKGTAGLLTALHGIVGCKNFGAIDPVGLPDLGPAEIDFDNDLVTLTSKEVSAAMPIDAGIEPASEFVPGDPAVILGYPPKAVSSFTTPLHVDQAGLKKWTDTAFGGTIEKRSGSPSHTIDLLALNGHVMPGHSGAPVLNLDGRVIGIVQGGVVISEIGLAVRIGTIKLVPFAEALISAIPTSVPDAIFSLATDETANELERQLIGMGIAIPPQAQTLADLAGLGAIDEVGAMLAFGTAPDAISPAGDTALRSAVLAGKVDVVRMLLSAGANPNDVPAHRDLPEEERVVALAVVQGEEDIILALLDADPAIGPGRYTDSRSERLARALRVAIQTNRSALIGPLLELSPELATLILANGKTALDLAVEQGRAQIVSTLVSFGAGGSKTLGETPLEIAIANDDAPTVAALNPAVSGLVNGCSALGLAIKARAIGVIRLLVESATINDIACEQDPALFVAMKALSDDPDSGKEVIDLILEAQPYIRNSRTGEIPDDLTLTMVRIDYAHRLHVIDKLRAGAPWDDIQALLANLLSQRSRVADDLLSAAAFALDAEAVEALISLSQPLTSHGLCRGGRAVPEVWPVSAVIDGFARGPRAGQLDAAKMVLAPLVAAQPDLIEGTCRSDSIIQQASSDTELLKEILRLRDSTTAKQLSYGLATAVFIGQRQLAAELLAAGARPCMQIADFQQSWDAAFAMDEPPATPLMLAVISGHQDLFADLWHARAKQPSDPSSESDCTVTLNHPRLVEEAVCLGHGDVLALLLDEPSVVSGLREPGQMDVAFACAAKQGASVVALLGESGMTPSLKAIGDILKDEETPQEVKAAVCRAGTSVAGAEVICQ